MNQKSIIASAAIMVGGVAVAEGERVSCDVETADFLIRHNRAVDDERKDAKATKADAGAAATKGTAQ